MTISDSLYRHWRTIKQRLGRGNAAAVEDRYAAADEGSLRAATDPAGVDFAELQTKADFLCELGMSPREFVVYLTEENGGRIRQQAFAECTGLSPSTISRTLSRMEADGMITRVKAGNENVVCLPDVAPASRGQTVPPRKGHTPQ